MKIFDLHCDTAFEMYTKKLNMDSENLDTRLSDFKKYTSPIQIYAIYSDHNKTDDENYEDFFKIRENLLNEIEENSDSAVFCDDREMLVSDDKRLKVMLSVEGSKLLGNDMSRLPILRELGVRVLTFMWKDEYAAGGSHNTDTGLTEFGRELVAECERLGIIVDVSHMSHKSFFDVVSCAKKPYIATHTNSNVLCDCSRNMTDIEFRTIVNTGGIVGVNMYSSFLSNKYKASETEIISEEIIQSMCKHIEYYLSLGGEKTVCLGCDRDGMDRVPGASELYNIDKVYERLVKDGVKESVAEDIFYNNAYNFFKNNL